MLSIAIINYGWNGYCNISLIALMKNQVDAMRGFSTEEGIAHFLNSSLTKTQMQKLNRMF